MATGDGLLRRLSRCATIALALSIGGSVFTAKAEAQDSYVTVSRSDVRANTCSNWSPLEWYYTYTTFTIRHQINCSGTIKTLETAYAYPQYMSGCSSYAQIPTPPSCDGTASANLDNFGTHYEVLVTATDRYRTYLFSEYACESGSTNSYGHFWFNKVNAEQACP